MKHLNINIVISLIFFWLLPQIGNSQQYTGISGLVHVPSGEMHHEGDAFIGAHFLNKNMLPDKGFLYPAYVGRNTILSTTIWHWLHSVGWS